MEHWIGLIILTFGASCCHAANSEDKHCQYDPCHNGATCMNVHRPINGTKIEHNGVAYLFVERLMTWFQAIDYCESEGGHLVSFEDKTEEHMDKSNLAETFWTSAQYHANASVWKWSPTNETFFDAPNIGEPGDCLAYEVGATLFEPQNLPCNSKAYVLCEAFSVWASQCRCPDYYRGPLCEEKISPEEDLNNYIEEECEGGETFSISCVSGVSNLNFIRIEYAAYGRFDNATCADGTPLSEEDLFCLAETSLQKIAGLCNAQPSCEIDRIGNAFFENDPCSAKKYVDVRFICVEESEANAPYTFALDERPDAYCAENNTGSYNWPRTLENTTATTSCGDDFDGIAIMDCLRDGVWNYTSLDTAQCTPLNDLLTSIRIGEDDAHELAEDLEDLVGEDSAASDLSTEMVVNILEELNSLQVQQLAESNQTSEEKLVTVSMFAQTTLSVGSYLLESEEESDMDSSLAVNVTDAMEDVAFLVADQLEEDSATTVSSDSIDMTCGSVPGGREALSYPSDPIFNDTSNGDAQVTVTLPASAFGSNSSTRNTIALLEYKTFTSIGNNAFASRYTSEEVVNQSVVNSIVFGASASRDGEAVTSFENGETFEFTLFHENPNITGNVTCVFWDSNDKTDSSSGSWSSRGCTVIMEDSNRTQTRCSCSHLTNFAILLDVTGVHQEIPDVHVDALKYLTIIGCSISIGCLSICIFAFSFFKSLWNTRTTIHRNLCISLLVAELLFLLGIERTENAIVCSVVAGVLHYSFLCAFAWMCLEGVQLYIMLVHVFSTSSRVLPYYLAGYGLPAVVVGVTAGVGQGDGYGVKGEDGNFVFCWLSYESGYIWSFAGPVAAVIVTNLVFLVVSLRIAYSGRSAVSKDATNSQNIKVWIKGAVTLTFLLGSTWAIGFLFLGAEGLVVAYVFTVLNSLQGMFIFIYHCLGNERVKKEMAKFLLRQKWLPACLRAKLESVAHVGSSSSHSTTQQSAVTTTENKYKKTDAVPLTEPKKDSVRPVVYIQQVDDDGKPRSWLYDHGGVGETNITETAEYY